MSSKVDYKQHISEVNTVISCCRTKRNSLHVKVALFTGADEGR